MGFMSSEIPGKPSEEMFYVVSTPILCDKELQFEKIQKVSQLQIILSVFEWTDFDTLLCIDLFRLSSTV